MVDGLSATAAPGLGHQMVDDGGVKYETRTVKAVRGMESRTAAKWECQGWEVVSQKTGKISSELTLRRPKQKTPWLLIAGLGGFVLVLILVLVIMNIVNGGGDGQPASTPAPTAVAEATKDPATEPSPAPTEPEPAESAAVVDTTVDELLDRLNSADMGGIQLGEQFRLNGELYMSELWYTGATGDYTVLLKAHDGADDLMVLLASESDAEGWTDGTRVEMVVENVEKTIDGETTDGWLQLVSATESP